MASNAENVSDPTATAPHNMRIVGAENPAAARFENFIIIEIELDYFDSCDSCVGLIRENASNILADKI